MPVYLYLATWLHPETAQGGGAAAESVCACVCVCV